MIFRFFAGLIFLGLTAVFQFVLNPHWPVAAIICLICAAVLWGLGEVAVDSLGEWND